MEAASLPLSLTVTVQRQGCRFHIRLPSTLDGRLRRGDGDLRGEAEVFLNRLQNQSDVFQGGVPTWTEHPERIFSVSKVLRFSLTAQADIKG